MPNYRTQRGSLSVQFPHAAFDASRTDIKAAAEIRQKAGAHDVAVVDLPGLSIDRGSDMLSYGAPAYIRWTTEQGSDQLYGYVHDYQPFTHQRERGTRVTVMSVGFTLKRRTTRIFQNLTASNIAQHIADEHGLDADIEPHARVFYQVPQDGISDWEVLCDLAARIGYSLRIEGVTLQFVSREALARHYRPMAPTLETSFLNPGEPGTRDVLSFTPMISEHQQVAGDTLANHVVRGLNLKGRPVEAIAANPASTGRGQSAPVLDQFHTVESAYSQVEATLIAKGHAETNRYPIRAHAVVWGDPRLAPNRVLRLDGLADGMSGYWTVLETIHAPRNGPLYQMELILGTEGLGSEAYSPLASTRTSLPPTGLLNMPYPAARLIQGIGAVKGLAVYTNGPRWAPVK